MLQVLSNYTFTIGVKRYFLPFLKEKTRSSQTFTVTLAFQTIRLAILFSVTALSLWVTDAVCPCKRKKKQRRRGLSKPFEFWAETAALMILFGFVSPFAYVWFRWIQTTTAEDLDEIWFKNVGEILRSKTCPTFSASDNPKRSVGTTRLG